MRDVTLLSGDDWQLAELPPKNNPVTFSPSQWIPARVPGNVQWDLQRAGIIPDPFVSTQNKECLWVQWKDWLVEKTIQQPSDWPASDGDHALLHFYATDYDAFFFLGNTRLGTHRGMFGDSWFDVTEILGSGEALPLRVALKNAPRNRRKALKCQMAYGWDFAPPIMTMGIWDDVELVHVGSVWVQNWFFQSQVLSVSGDRSEARVTCDVFLKNLAANPIAAKIAVEVEDLGVLGTCETRLGPGISTIRVGPAHFDAELWFPNEMGPQKVYSATITIEAGGTILDQVVSCQFGIRDLRMQHNPGTPGGRQPWTFVVNNHPTFIRGANWVPPDSYFGQINFDTYKRLLDLARDAHINMFRVWGGGIREKRWFYDLCDEYGILLWQEFPFGCANYPNDPAYLALVERECSNTVHRIWNHPALAIYVGGNEFDPDYNRHLVNILAKCAAQDPTRSFYDASPCKGDAHNWIPWHMLADFAAYKLDYQFSSEFGFQAVPNLETVQAMLKPEEQWPLNEAWKYHSAQINKLQRYGLPVCDQTDLKTWIFSTQVAQAEGIKYGIEHFRRSKWRNSGVLFWQLNEPWPTVCWSVIDYFGRPKLAYEYVKEIYNPLLGMLDYKLKARQLSADVVVTNDYPVAREDLTVQVKSHEWNVVREIFSAPVTVPATSIQLAGNFAFDLPAEWSLKDKFGWKVQVLLLDCNGETLSTNN